MEIFRKVSVMAAVIIAILTGDAGLSYQKSGVKEAEKELVIDIDGRKYICMLPIS